MPLSVQHHKSVTLADWSGTVTVANSTGGTTTANGSDLARPSDWNSAHDLTFSLSASELNNLFSFGTGLSSTTDTNGISAGINSVGYYEPFVFIGSTLAAAAGHANVSLDPFFAPMGLPTGRILSPRQVSAPFIHGAVFTCSLTGSVTKYATVSNRLAIYSQGTGASSTALYSAWTGDANSYATQVIAQTSASTTATGTTSNTISNYATISIPTAWDSAGGVTYGTFTASGTRSTTNTSVNTTFASSFADSLVSGLSNYVGGSVMDGFGLNTALPPNNYWMAYMYFTATSTTGTNNGVLGSVLGLTHSRLLMNEVPIAGVYRLGGASTTNQVSFGQLFRGPYATTTSAMPAKIASTDFGAIGNPRRLYWNLAQQTYS